MQNAAGENNGVWVCWPAQKGRIMGGRNEGGWGFRTEAFRYAVALLLLCSRFVLGLARRLLARERDHRVDSRSPSGGNQAGQQGDQRKQHRNRSKGKRVGGFNAEKQTLHQPRKRKSPSDSNPDASQGQRHPMTDHEPQNISLRSSKRDANAQFARALTS